MITIIHLYHYNSFESKIMFMHFKLLRNNCGSSSNSHMKED